MFETLNHQLEIKNKQEQLRLALLETIDPSSALSMSKKELEFSVFQNLNQLCQDLKISMSLREQQQLTREMIDDILGLGPLEVLLKDTTVSDILVNGYQQVYVERFGKLELSDITFRDQEHVHNMAQRIAAQVGRRIDEASPMVDARLADGSRVNVIAPPLSLTGTTISIRKFSNKVLSLTTMAEQGNMNRYMADLLALYVTSKLNIIVSGGTGAGKTTLLNALSEHIGQSERLITIEDAAEIKLMQPHVISLETRAASVEGTGHVTQTDLLKNALRMRPDRILLGEVRGAEVFDMLQAMNTGHDGSLSTVHANTPQDALVRLENMLSMCQSNISSELIRRQIASSIDVVVQVERCRDGIRRITDISEISGCVQGKITLNKLFSFNTKGQINGDLLVGQYVCQSNVSVKQNKLMVAGFLVQLEQLLAKANQSSTELCHVD